MLYSFLREMEEQPLEEYRGRRLEEEEESRMRQLTNPESKKSLHFDFRKLELCPSKDLYSYLPPEKVDKPKKEEVRREERPLLVAHEPHHSPMKRLKEE